LYGVFSFVVIFMTVTLPPLFECYSPRFPCVWRFLEFLSSRWRRGPLLQVPRLVDFRLFHGLDSGISPGCFAHSPLRLDCSTVCVFTFSFPINRPLLFFLRYLEDCFAPSAPPESAPLGFDICHFHFPLNRFVLSTPFCRFSFFLLSTLPPPLPCYGSLGFSAPRMSFCDLFTG